MEKNWYIWNKDQHMGPFTEVELVSMFDKNEIFPQTRVWKEAMPQWIPYFEAVKTFKLFEIENVPEDMPPPFIPEPTDEVEHIDEIQTEVNNEIRPENVAKTELRQPDTEELSSEIIDQNKSLKSWMQLFVGFAISVGVIVGLYSWSKMDINYIPIMGIAQKDGLEIERLINEAHMSKTKMHIFMTDKNKIIVATNRIGPMRLKIVGESIDGQVLADDKVIFESEGMLENSTAVFYRYKFIRGNQVVPGQYMLSVTGVSDSKTHKIIEWLRNKNMLFGFINLNHFQKEIAWRGPYYLGQKTKEQFEQDLLKKKIEVNQHVIAQIDDMLQSNETLLALVDKIDKLFAAKIKIYTKGTSVKSFVDTYAKEMAPVLQTIIVGLASKDKDLRPQEAELHKKLVQFGKKIPVIVNEMVKRIQGQTKITALERSQLSEDLDQYIMQLKSEGHNLDSDLKTEKQKLLNP